eukprot:scaffold3175_cov309-Prasinococcus_capsulatus_cf.AAC.4
MAADARGRALARRAGVRAAAPPEGDRGGAGARHHGGLPQDHRRGRRRRRARRRLRRRGHGGVHRGRAHARVLLHGDEHAPAGGAPRHRDDHRHRPRGVAAARGHGRAPAALPERAVHPGARPRSLAPCAARRELAQPPEELTPRRAAPRRAAPSAGALLRGAHLRGAARARLPAGDGAAGVRALPRERGRAGARGDGRGAGRRHQRLLRPDDRQAGGVGRGPRARAAGARPSSARAASGRTPHQRRLPSPAGQPPELRAGRAAHPLHRRAQGRPAPAPGACARTTPRAQRRSR